MISLRQKFFDEMIAHAREEDPNECCGLLAARDGAVTKHYRITNAERSPYRYSMDGKELLAAYREIEDNGWEIEVIYHSHPNGQAYLSPTDREVATSPWGDGPAYPVQQLVVGIDQHRVVEAALYAWSDEDEGFVEIARYEGAAT